VGDELTQARAGVATTYRIVAGTAPDAPIVEHEARAGSLRIGDEIYVNGAMRVIYSLAPFDADRNADFVAVLAAPPVVLTLNGDLVELYRSELVQLRAEIARLADRREPTASLLATIDAMLNADQAQLEVSDEEVAVLSDALHALEVSDGLSERLRAVWNAIRDYLRRQRPPA